VSEKQKGLYRKYLVQKLTDPEKKLECVVLEFDDPVARVAILAFARAAQVAGYRLLAEDLHRKLLATAPSEFELDQLVGRLAEVGAIINQEPERIKGLLEILKEEENV